MVYTENRGRLETSRSGGMSAEPMPHLQLSYIVRYGLD